MENNKPTQNLNENEGVIFHKNYEEKKRELNRYFKNKNST